MFALPDVMLNKEYGATEKKCIFWLQNDKTLHYILVIGKLPLFSVFSQFPQFGKGMGEFFPFGRSNSRRGRNRGLRHRHRDSDSEDDDEDESDERVGLFALIFMYFC